MKNASFPNFGSKVTFLLGGLACLGFAIASYFTGVRYHWVQPNTRWIPIFCRLDKHSCAAVVFTRQAHLFGLPNSILGQGYYLTLLIGLSFDWQFGSLQLLFAYILASVFTVVVGLYLTYALVRVLRVPCVLCLVSHSINLIIMIGLILLRFA